MLLVYAQSSSQRLQYILETLLPVLGIQGWELTTDKFYFKNTTASVYINYSDTTLRQNELHIIPYGLISEINILPQKIIMKEWNGLPCFFSTPGEISFDILSAAFFLISRYEEYLLHVTDKHDRFPHAESVAFQNQFLHLPLVNLWLKEMRSVLQNIFPAAVFHLKSFQFVPSYDVDIAYRYKANNAKNVYRFLKHIVQFKLRDISLQWKVQLNKAKDPFDVFDWLNELHKTHHLQPVYFFLSGKSSALDKNIPINRLKKLIEKLVAGSIGLHPSGGTTNHDRQLLIEKLKLERVADRKISYSRQHYLKFRLPKTYRSIAAFGITDEYSMGYANINGFRASFCNSFRWFDLKRNAITNMIVHPFCFMDSTSIFSLKQTAFAAKKELTELYETVFSVNGTMITIMHNHFLTEQDHAERRVIYQSFLEQLSQSSQAVIDQVNAAKRYEAANNNMAR